jgi:hypothetical protein
MIVRVQGSGQYRLEDGAVSGLNNLDRELLDAVSRHDEPGVTAALYKMIAYVQTAGKPVDPDEVVPSDAILPPDDLTYEEIVAVLKEDGLIPG